MPIILCTGYSELINETQAREMGIREFVMKPYMVANFAETIRKSLNTR
jgi:FixJ family two-component response regulator